MRQTDKVRETEERDRQSERDRGDRQSERETDKVRGISLQHGSNRLSSDTKSNGAVYT